MITTSFSDLKKI